MLVLYFGIAYGYQAYLRSSVTKLDQDIAKFGERIPQADQEKTAEFYSALVNLRELLKTHTSASPVFALLERTANTNIYYTKLNLNTVTNEVDLVGVARNLQDAAALAALLSTQPEVSRINFTNAGNQNGVWQFTMNLFLNPNVLHASGSAPQANSLVPVATSSPIVSNPTSTASSSNP
jgi:hypothetical protein